MPEKTPFLEDTIVTAAAERAGFDDVMRRQVLDVDEKALPPQYFRRAIDYAKIRRDLDNGIAVPGVRLTTDVEFVIRRTRTASSPATPANPPNDKKGDPRKRTTE